MAPPVTIPDIENRIISILGEKGPQTRADLCVNLGITKINTYKCHGKQCQQFAQRTTIYDVLVKLMARHVVDKHSVQNGMRGRPITIFQLKGGVLAT